MPIPTSVHVRTICPVSDAFTLNLCAADGEDGPGEGWHEAQLGLRIPDFLDHLPSDFYDCEGICCEDREERENVWFHFAARSQPHKLPQSRRAVRTGSRCRMSIVPVLTCLGLMRGGIF